MVADHSSIARQNSQPDPTGSIDALPTRYSPGTRTGKLGFSSISERRIFTP
jgi:hypothetical protein